MLAATEPLRQQAHTPEPWKCVGCHMVLGVITGDTVRIKHRRRQIEAHLPCSQVCDECGTLNMLDSGPHNR